MGVAAETDGEERNRRKPGVEISARADGTGADGTGAAGVGAAGVGAAGVVAASVGAAKMSVGGFTL
jgi:hypothetical protein